MMQAVLRAPACDIIELPNPVLTVATQKEET